MNLTLFLTSKNVSIEQHHIENEYNNAFIENTKQMSPVSP